MGKGRIAIRLMMVVLKAGCEDDDDRRRIPALPLIADRRFRSVVSRRQPPVHDVMSVVSMTAATGKRNNHIVVIVRERHHAMAAA